MVDAARVPGRALSLRPALLVGEDGDQPPVAGIEVQVALGGVVEIGLLEDERHPQHALPEVDRRLPVGPDDRDVVDPLALELAHQPLFPVSTSLDWYSLRGRAPNGTSSPRVVPTSTPRPRRWIESASAMP